MRKNLVKQFSSFVKIIKRMWFVENKKNVTSNHEVENFKVLIYNISHVRHDFIGFNVNFVIIKRVLLKWIALIKLSNELIK